MPHITVKLYPGKTEEQKKKLAEDLTNVFVTTLGYREASLSVGIEEVPSEEWRARVVEPEILGKPTLLYKAPGYPT